MRLMRTGCLLILACGLLAAALPAVEQGDLAPRGTLGYARAKNVADGLKRLAGDDWMSLFDRALKVRRESERRDSDPVINEIKRFVDHANTLEIALVDVMVRDPHVQMIFVLHLAEGAPKELSESLIQWLKKEAPKDAKVSTTEISDQDFSLRLRPGFAVFTIGGAARNHVDDVLQGDTAESLSKVERFTKWNQRATSDIEMWLDMKALRNAIDKLGEDFRMDRDMREFLTFTEWEKWDTVTGSAMLPSKTGGGVSVTLDVSFSQPLEVLSAVMRPAGSARLVKTLPAETIGFLSAQLGSDADATFTGIARMMHDIQMRSEPDRIRRNIDWAREDLNGLERQLKNLEEGGKDGGEEDKDGRKNSGSEGFQDRTEAEPMPSEGGDEPYDPEQTKEQLKKDIARAKERIATLEQELRDHTRRPFSADREGRTSDSTEGEQMYDEADKILKSMGIDRTELSQVVGSEIIAGFVALPDPTGDAFRDMFEHNWFVSVEMREGHQAMKQKLIDWALGKALPEGASEEEKEEAKRRASEMLFKKVEGGELLRPRGAFAGVCAYFGDNLVGIAGSEEIALRVLKANSGGASLSPGNIPGGTAGSKLLYIDLGEFLARVEQESSRRDNESRSFISPRIDVRKLLKSGLRLGVTSSEGTTRITFTASTAGENSFRPTMEKLTTELELERAWRHDQSMLEDLGNGIHSWISQNDESLRAMSADDLKAALAAIAPAKLMADGFFSPQDGMRSAFDPAMAARLAAMIEKGANELGGEGEAGDMAETGFDWFGMPATLKLDDMGRYGWGELRDIWLVCATKGTWVRGGRAALVFAGNSPRAVWLEEADFKQIRLTNAAGRRLASLAVSEPELPKWKVKARLSRNRWSMHNTGDYLRQAIDKAKQEGREFELNFDGSKEEDPLNKLRQALGISPDDWFEIENSKQLEITAKGDKYRIRIKQGDVWVELDQDGKVTSSWDNE